MKKTIIITLAIYLFTSPSYANNTNETVNCNKKDLANVEIQYCANVVADKALNTSYKRLMQAINNNHYKDALENAQNAWLTFKDAECRLRSAPHKTEAGAKFETALSQCSAELSNSRTIQLVKMLASELISDEEAD